MSKVLVLGGSYFVGRKLVEELCQQKYEVTVLNRGTREVPMAGVQQIICDRNQPMEMKHALAGKEFDYVIDVSWQDVNWVKYACDAIEFRFVKQLIFISSSAVYDVDALKIPFHEEDRLGENKYWTCYGKGKIEAEQYYREYLKEKESRLVILRPPYIYGEYNYAQRESLIFRQIVEDQPVIIPASNPMLQFIYTGDLARIIIHLFEVNQEKCCIYNVGNKKSVSSAEWIRECAKIVGKQAVISKCDYEALGMQVRDFYPFFDYDNVLDVTKIERIYNQEMDFSEGLALAFDWFQKNRSQIVFKAEVDLNLYEMIAKLSI